MMNRITLLTVILLAILFGGCAQQMGEKIIPYDPGDCPGKKSIQEVVKIIKLQKQNVMALQASAECIMSWREADGKEKDEQVSGKLAFVPAEFIFFKGDKFGEIRFGTNEDEFWLRVKPQLDTYWYGTKVQAAECNEKLLINPANVAEALGVVDITTDWVLSNRDGYDIVDNVVDGKKKKRAYINTCDYRIELIEYFDSEEVKRVGIELEKYTTNDEGIMVPSSIRVSYYDDMGLEESAVQFNLKNVRYFPPEKQKKKLFERPGRDGYNEVYRLNEFCDFELEEE